MAKTIKVLKEIKVNAEAVEIVKLLAADNRVDEVATAMECNKRTMEAKIGAIKAKFNVDTLYGLVALFIRKEIIK